MNINDFKLEDLNLESGDEFDAMIQRQIELMQKYHSIEERNGFLITPDVPVNLHDAKGQFRLKDFAWRITEELGEALEALSKHPEIRDHYDEELADALHFLIEFTILSGIPIDGLRSTFHSRMRWSISIFSSSNSSRSYQDLCGQVGEVVKNLAVACNCLKNKPWKVSQMMTDTAYFNECVGKIWVSFIDLCAWSGIGYERLFDLYFRKSEVNKFRQRSNY